MHKPFFKIIAGSVISAGLAAAQILMNDIPARPDEAKMEGVRRRAAAFEEKQFRERMNQFASAWNLFIVEYQDRGTFNVKKAKAVQHAWKIIESNLPR